jgi:hypothetical protein
MRKARSGPVFPSQAAKLRPESPSKSTDGIHVPAPPSISIQSVSLGRFCTDTRENEFHPANNSLVRGAPWLTRTSKRRPSRFTSNTAVSVVSAR